MDPALHVAVDANVLNASWGGIPKYLDRIARELTGRGDRVDLLVTRRGRSLDVSGAHEVAVWVKGRPVWRNTFVPAWASLRKPHVYWAPEGILPRWLPVPTVVTLHDLAPILFPGSKSPTQESEFRGVAARSARAATRVIAVSQTTADDAGRLWDLDGGRLRVVPNGVDECFSPGDCAAAREAVHRRFGLKQSIVLAVGSLEPRKGLEVLIEAAKLARAGRAPWHLVLAGSCGFGGEALLAAARASGNCTALGPVSDEELVDLYRAAEAVAVPSLYEGFGMTALEAMACGTPTVIAARSGGLEEISGPAAVIVDERTAEAWYVALADAASRRSELADRGVRHASRFSWQAAAEATRAVLLEAAHAGRRG